MIVHTSARPHSRLAHRRRCERGHHFLTTELAAQWTTAKGQARYWCPKCFRAGRLPPTKSWRKVMVAVTGGSIGVEYGDP